MARTSRSEDVQTSHFVRAWRKHRGLTLEHLSEQIGMTHQNLGKIERGKVPLGEEYLPRLARALGIAAPDLFRSPDDDSTAIALVPVVGRVGADPEGQVIYSTGHDSGDRAPPPPGGSVDSVALEVIGHSMRGWADDGSLIYFETQKTPPTPDMIGYPAIVETVDGRVLLKKLLKGSRSGLFDLESLNGPTLADQRIVWAAEITAIIPPRQARRIILRRGEAA